MKFKRLPHEFNPPRAITLVYCENVREEQRLSMFLNEHNAQEDQPSLYL